MPRFFPEAWFGWLWLALLLGLVLAAAYVDFRRYVIPKALSLSLLLAGTVLQMVRGAWLGSQEIAVWLLPPGIVWGALDGLVFALAGFVTGFGLFFALWLLRTCGGGDVKLFAAIATWTGPNLALWVLGASVFVVAVLASLKGIFLLLVGRRRELVSQAGGNRVRRPGRHSTSRNQERTVQEMLEQGERPKRLMSFSLPLAISLALVLGWKFWEELRLPWASNWHSPTNTGQTSSL